MVTIYSKGAVAQVILDEPPKLLWETHKKGKYSIYMRVEPNAPVRDVAPSHTAVEDRITRLRFSGATSDTIWAALLELPDDSTRQRINEDYEMLKSMTRARRRQEEAAAGGPAQDKAASSSSAPIHFVPAREP